MRNTIIFYAPLGKGLPPEKIGGAEAGCIKTIEILKSFGYEIIILDKPANNKGIFNYLFEMASIPFKLLYLLKTNNNSVLHIAGFYLQLVSFEWFLMKLALLSRHKIIYEIRNGGMIQAYNRGGKLYKYFMKSLIVDSSQVLCQGLEYVEFISKKWGKMTTYYPNYILDKFISKNNHFRSNPIKLVYVGRITEAKNINVVIDIFNYILTKGIKAELHLIGGFSREYKESLDQRIKKYQLDSSIIKFHGRQNFAYINDVLKASHYFVFPSEEKREGHSNALTEAMGCGVVPVVSNAGFNSSICGFPELVVSRIDYTEFGDTILAIENNGDWDKYSSLVYNRILENYTESIVKRNLISTVDNLFQ